MFRENPTLALSVGDLVAKFDVSKPTIHSDLVPLLERELLKKIPINQKESNYVKGNRFDIEISDKEI